MQNRVDSSFLKTKKISLRLDRPLADRLQDRADRDRVPVSYLLRHLVLRFLGESKDKEPPALPALRGVPGAALLTRSERLQEEFREEVCTLFDSFLAQGVESKEAIKRVNLALKDKKHPWATFEVVAGVLRSQGRLRGLSKRVSTTKGGGGG